MEKFLYYNGQLLETKYSNTISDIILKLGLKSGDLFELLPFNNLSDEDTNYRGEKMEYHTNLKITDIKYTLLESWNNNIRTKVEIFLEKQ